MGLERLTSAELRAADALAAFGCSNLRLAYFLSFTHDKVSEAVVKKHLGEAMRKTGARNRTQLSVWWNCELFQIGLKELGLR